MSKALRNRSSRGIHGNWPDPPAASCARRALKPDTTDHCAMNLRTIRGTAMLDSSGELQFLSRRSPRGEAGRADPSSEVLMRFLRIPSQSSRCLLRVPFLFAAAAQQRPLVTEDRSDRRRPRGG